LGFKTVVNQQEKLLTLTLDVNEVLRRSILLRRAQMKREKTKKNRRREEKRREEKRREEKTAPFYCFFSQEEKLRPLTTRV